MESAYGHPVCRADLTALPPVKRDPCPGPESEKIDLVITLGGDGTILHASSLFKSGAVPPVLSFSMGTLGFLLPFREHLLGTCHYLDSETAFQTQMISLEHLKACLRARPRFCTV